jgi:hypothetical protein
MSKVPAIKELVSVVSAYNAAREHELRMMPPGGFPKEYKAPEFIEALYDCAVLAARQLKPALEAGLEVEKLKA